MATQYIEQRSILWWISLKKLCWGRWWNCLWLFWMEKIHHLVLNYKKTKFACFCLQRQRIQKSFWNWIIVNILGSSKHKILGDITERPNGKIWTVSMSLIIAEERKVTIFLASINLLDSSEAFRRIIYPNQF